MQITQPYFLITHPYQKIRAPYSGALSTLFVKAYLSRWISVMAIKKLHDVLSRLKLDEASGVFPLPDTMQLCNVGYVTQIGWRSTSKSMLRV